MTRHLKTLFTTTTLLALGLAGPSHAALIGSWNFDGDFTDGSGNGNTLTETDAGTDNSGIVGTAKVGTGAYYNAEAGDFLSMTTPIDFDGTESWSVALWVKKDAADTAGMLVGDRSTGTDFIWYRSGTNAVFVTTESSTTFSSSVDGVVLDTDWHHLAIVYDQPADELTLYQDGTPLATKTEGGNGAITFANVAGAFNGNTSFDLVGLIDEVYIYDEAIDASTVASLVPEPGSVALLGLGGLLIARRRRQA